jgi:hypothetical protein
MFRGAPRRRSETAAEQGAGNRGQADRQAVGAEHVPWIREVTEHPPTGIGQQS